MDLPWVNDAKNGLRRKMDLTNYDVRDHDIFLVLINEELRGTITPSRGLHQGDPISPYLFLLCTEGLTALLRKKEVVGLIRGVVVSKLAPLILYLFFADDCIIFCRATMEECRQVASVLEVYEKESRQKLNREKNLAIFQQEHKGRYSKFCEGYFWSPNCQTTQKVLGITPNGWKRKEKGF